MNRKRTIYLKKKSLDEARTVLLAKMAPLLRLGTETVPVGESRGRVLAEPVFARVSSPPFHCSAMDGIAVRAQATYGAGEETPKILRIGEDAFPVNTGNPLPTGTDAVIMIEDVHPVHPDRAEIREAAHPWQHVRAMGEDVAATEMLFPANRRISAYDLGALLAGGHAEATVWKRPKVFILPTGSEVVEPGPSMLSELSPSRSVIESNSSVLSGLVLEDGGDPVRLPVVRDDPRLIREALDSAASGADLILMIAGSSAGSEDYTRSIIEERGDIYVHGIAIMPGKPTMLGTFGGRPIVGIPGYPVSAIIAYEELVRPLLAGALGQIPPEKPRLRVVSTRKIPSKLGTEEFLRVKIGKIGETFLATPLPRGSGMITSLTRADGIIRIPALSEGIDEKEEIDAELVRPIGEIERTVVMVGSHDLTLDLLADELGRLQPPLFFSSHSVGSLGGILAVRDGICHMAGAHLLDPETGEYNFPYLRRYLPGARFRVIHLVYREQGLIVQPGNPRGIRGPADLLRDGVSFVNRQKGSGTRILLDHTLKELSIDPAGIRGYDREEYTHMAVVSAVAGGVADAGMGILSAAKALDMGFVPIARERYDLIIPAAFFETPSVQRVIETIRSEAFKARVLEMGGYDVSRTGEELKE